VDAGRSEVVNVDARGTLGGSLCTADAEIGIDVGSGIAGVGAGGAPSAVAGGGVEVYAGVGSLGFVFDPGADAGPYPHHELAVDGGGPGCGAEGLSADEVEGSLRSVTIAGTAASGADTSDDVAAATATTAAASGGGGGKGVGVAVVIDVFDFDPGADEDP
jgi:hypothetical protein